MDSPDSVCGILRRQARENQVSTPSPLTLNWGVVGRLTQRLHVGANDIANPADFGVAVDFVDAGLFLVKTIL